MGPPKPALWALLLVLLGTTQGRAGLRTCSVPDVLRHYRAVIFQDLQAAARWVGPGGEGTGLGSRHLHFVQRNLTGAAASRRRGRVGASCGAQKERSILLSILSLGRTLRGAVARGRRRALEKVAWTVAVRTEAVMQRYCWTLRQQSWRPQTRPSRRRGGRRWLLLHALDAIATCWEKLFALRAAAAQQGEEERARLRKSLTGAQPTHRSLCSPKSPRPGDPIPPGHAGPRRARPPRPEEALIN
ncbi:uncharacterized protein C20orf204 homolog isoform X1 [Vicugna pacos]|uniref:Uncharacterized protein C20orf204 homolog isoform X1 n=1 Tax=Vicugna pacos TaxID=30538 RepID=A0ABM5BWF5_VICPA